MGSPNGTIRVLYSFPHKIGADRICGIAWHQVEGLVEAGAQIALCTGAVHRPLPSQVKIQTTLAWKGLRLPYRLVGSLRAFALHDWRVSRTLRRLAGEIDVVHTWPLGALQ